MKRLVTVLAIATTIGGTILGGMAVIEANAQSKSASRPTVESIVQSKENNKDDKMESIQNIQNIQNIESIEKDLKNILEKKIKVTDDWDDEMEKKYGDDWDDMLEQKYGDDWEDKFEDELRKQNLLLDDDKDDDDDDDDIQKGIESSG